MTAIKIWKPALVVALVIAGAAGMAVAGGGVPAPVASVAAMLKKAGYTDVAVGQRVFGGYVVQARDGDTFALFTIRPDGETLETAELFRDANEDDIFSNDEALHPQDALPLSTAVRQALAASKDDAQPVELTAEETLSMPGFAQQREPLFAGASLRVTAAERVGSGTVTTRSEGSESARSVRGSAMQSFRLVESTVFSDLNDRQLASSLIEAGGVVGSFAPLTFDTADVDADAIRDMAMADAPDADALRDSVTAAAPDAAAMATAIRAGVPTADAIRAAILSPGQ